MGLEKTIILYNISEVPNCPRNQKHLHFPYIDPEKFYQLLDEIVKEGLAWEEESNE